MYQTTWRQPNVEIERLTFSRIREAPGFKLGRSHQSLNVDVRIVSQIWTTTDSLHSLAYSLTIQPQVTPWMWVLPQKPTAAQTLKNSQAFYGTPKVHYHVHKSLSLIPILCHMTPVHIIPSYLIMIHFNIILPPTSVFLVVSFLLALPSKFYMHSSPQSCVLHATTILSSLTWSFWLCFIIQRFDIYLSYLKRC
jgi:hypothetical protein